MRLLALLPLALLACSDGGASPSEPAPAPSASLTPGVHQPDPEDTDCGVTCEPYSTLPCELPGGGTGTQVCGPTGLGYSACGATDWAPQPSSCAEGFRCVRRAPGGNMGCRAICKPEAGKGCDGGLERIACEAPTPKRAEAADCKPGDAEGVYCCPAGAAILNPL